MYQSRPGSQWQDPCARLELLRVQNFVKRATVALRRTPGLCCDRRACIFEAPAAARSSFCTGCSTNALLEDAGCPPNLAPQFGPTPGLCVDCNGSRFGEGRNRHRADRSVCFRVRTVSVLRRLPYCWQAWAKPKKLSFFRAKNGCHSSHGHLGEDRNHPHPATKLVQH